MYQHLKEFIESLDRAGELTHIRYPVSPYLEISKITDHESKSPEGGKALYFEHVIGSKFPVVTNIFGSNRRICMALGVHQLDDIADRIRQYIELSPPRNIREALQVIPLVLNVGKFIPRMIKQKKVPCQEVIRTGGEVDLNLLPVLHCWPKDAGRFITLPVVFTKSLITGKRNAGMYRMQIFDKCSTGMHWHIHKDGSHYYSEYKKAKKRMPVAVSIGADPATMYAATAPLPRGIDELLLAGFIRKKPVTLTKCITIDMEVPAESEFVLEGYVEPDELRIEGPFGDHTGYYSLPDYYPVFHVTAITHRIHPIYPATLVGRPPMEDCYLAKATERIFLPLLQAIFPEIRDYWFPWEGVFHNIVIISIDKEYPKHAQKMMSALWGQGQMSFCKAIVVVDKTVAPQNGKHVLEILLQRLDMTSDIVITQGILDVLDHSSPFPNFGNKIGIDLTERIDHEPPRKKLSVLNLPDMNSISEILHSHLPGYITHRHISYTHLNINCRHRILAISIDKAVTNGGKDIASKIFELIGSEFFTIFLIYDKDINLFDNSLILWKLFNNVDPGRDMFFFKDCVCIDACKKTIKDGHLRDWPDDLTFDG